MPRAGAPHRWSCNIAIFCKKLWTSGLHQVRFLDLKKFGLTRQLLEWYLSCKHLGIYHVCIYAALFLGSGRLPLPTYIRYVVACVCKVCIDFNMPFSILALVSSRYGSRDDTRVNMEKTCYNLIITYLSSAEKRKQWRHFESGLRHNINILFLPSTPICVRRLKFTITGSDHMVWVGLNNRHILISNNTITILEYNGTCLW